MLTLHHVLGIFFCLVAAWFAYEATLAMLDMEPVGFFISFVIFAILFCIGNLFITMG
jgi:hypothetical protein